MPKGPLVHRETNPNRYESSLVVELSSSPVSGISISRSCEPAGRSAVEEFPDFFSRRFTAIPEPAAFAT